MLKRSYGSSSKSVPPDPKKCQIKTKDEYCKKFETGCEKAKTFSCKKTYVPPCKKVLAPYPSYSESCHEEYEPRPDQCKICPRRGEDIDYQGYKKKKYHTMIDNCFARALDDYVRTPMPISNLNEQCNLAQKTKNSFKAKRCSKSDDKKKSVSLSMIHDNTINNYNDLLLRKSQVEI